MEPLEAVRAVFDAWEAGDADSLRDLFCEDGLYVDPLKPATLAGVDEVVEGNRPAMAAIEDCRVTVDVALERNGVAVVEGTFASGSSRPAGAWTSPSWPSRRCATAASSAWPSTSTRGRSSELGFRRPSRRRPGCHDP